ncbi:MAG: translation initiation factor IF-3 [Oscillospiraceae bacterium]|nr:translation initiation factor IF-3 [Oscillospiraceae bacterium]MBR2741037.1 translation initiation factor IF-3 [Oscillospiraceae bacterium]
MLRGFSARFCFYNPFSQLRRYKAIAAQNHLVNEDIKAPEVRLVGADGSQLGIMETSKALTIAEQEGMDLVLIAPQATPPVCRVMDYGKYRFDQQKREKEQRKNQKTVEVKEIRLSLNIDVHDFDTKVDQAKKFLSAGNKLKVSIRFRGREMAHTDRGTDVMNRFQEAVGDAATVDKPAKLEGRSMQMFMSPKTGK